MHLPPHLHALLVEFVLKPLKRLVAEIMAPKELRGIILSQPRYVRPR